MTPLDVGISGRRKDNSDSVLVQSHRLAAARHTRIAQELSDPELDETADEIARLMSCLRDARTSIQMLPIEPVFSTYRGERDLSTGLCKSVTLETRGGEPEVYKTIIDSLRKPLLHIFRISIGRGLKTPQSRRAAGKTKEPPVLLKARQSGVSVPVSISDHGGLVPEAVRRCGIECGLIARNPETSAERIVGLIFAIGLSTAKVPSGVSGRDGGTGRAASDDRQEAITGVVGRCMGLAVDDEVIDPHRAVIKPPSLPHRIKELPKSSILGGGPVALILKPAKSAKRIQGAQRVAA